MPTLLLIHWKPAEIETELASLRGHHTVTIESRQQGSWHRELREAPLNVILAALSGWEPGLPKKDYYLLGISPAGIGAVGMAINFAVSFIGSMLSPEPPADVQEMVESIRVPSGAGEAHEMQVPPM